MAKVTMMTTTATSGRPLRGRERRLSEESWLARPRLTGGEYSPRLGAAAMHRNRAAPHGVTQRKHRETSRSNEKGLVDPLS